MKTCKHQRIIERLGETTFAYCGKAEKDVKTAVIIVTDFNENAGRSIANNNQCPYFLNNEIEISQCKFFEKPVKILRR